MSVKKKVLIPRFGAWASGETAVQSTEMEKTKHRTGVLGEEEIENSILDMLIVKYL